mmetsp:Transcript_95932/g.268540  ORF Transcript_95932/g.268540 Transcript_95932/m.268540 type:complete len:125 (-) Transcript_95932:87-461(-)
MKWITVFSLSSVAAAYLQPVAAFGLQSKQDVSLSPPDMSRSQFLAVVGVLTAGAAPAWSKDSEALKGTKKDPVFEQCLSQCMYDCTKPKGVEQKSRGECLPECKEKCATSKAQLLKGEPLKEQK